MRFKITIILIFIAAKMFGQDKIIRTNGDTITGYISIVEKEDIKYRKVDDRSQPIYTIKKTLVDRIVYENGDVEKMEVTQEMVKAEEYNFRHRISWVYTDVFIARMTFAYEYLNKSGSIGLRVPFGAGITLVNYNNNAPGMQFVTGLDLNIYPTTARGLVKYYFGPMTRVGYTSGDLFEGRESLYYSFMFGNGVSVNIIPQLNMSAYMGVGVKFAHYYDGYYYYDNNGQMLYQSGHNTVYPNMVFGLSFGYNFGK